MPQLCLSPCARRDVPHVLAVRSNEKLLQVRADRLAPGVDKDVFTFVVS